MTAASVALGQMARSWLTDDRLEDSPTGAPSPGQFPNLASLPEPAWVKIPAPVATKRLTER